MLVIATLFGETDLREYREKARAPGLSQRFSLPLLGGAPVERGIGPRLRMRLPPSRSGLRGKGRMPRRTERFSGADQAEANDGGGRKSLEPRLRHHAPPRSGQVVSQSRRTRSPRSSAASASGTDNGKSRRMLGQVRHGKVRARSTFARRRADPGRKERISGMPFRSMKRRYRPIPKRKSSLHHCPAGSLRPPAKSGGPSRPPTPRPIRPRPRVHMTPRQA